MAVTVDEPLFALPVPSVSPKMMFLDVFALDHQVRAANRVRLGCTLPNNSRLALRLGPVWVNDELFSLGQHAAGARRQVVDLDDLAFFVDQIVAK